jgi:hypothetical protein
MYSGFWRGSTIDLKRSDSSIFKSVFSYTDSCDTANAAYVAVVSRSTTYDLYIDDGYGKIH